MRHVQVTWTNTGARCYLPPRANIEEGVGPQETVTVKSGLLDAFPPFVRTEILPVVAPLGTVATTW